MALTKNHQLNGIQIPNAYIKIVELYMSEHQPKAAQITVNIYASAQHAKEHQHIYTKHHAIPCTKEQLSYTHIYNQLKKLQEYTNATDC